MSLWPVDMVESLALTSSIFAPSYLTQIDWKLYKKGVII